MGLAPESCKWRDGALSQPSLWWPQDQDCPHRAGDLPWDGHRKTIVFSAACSSKSDGFLPGCNSLIRGKG